MVVAFSKRNESSLHKKEINEKIAKLGRRDGYALVLDGPSMHTTKALLKNGYKEERIIIPNFSSDYKQIEAKGYGDLLVYGSLKLALQTHARPIGLVYMDYMCSLEGNKDCRPKEDIEIYFAKDILDGSCLAITITERTGRWSKNSKLFRHSSATSLISFVTQAAFGRGYCAVLMGGGFYKNGGPMFTAIFQINKVIR